MKAFLDAFKLANNYVPVQTPSLELWLAVKRPKINGERWGNDQVLPDHDNTVSCVAFPTQTQYLVQTIISHEVFKSIWIVEKMYRKRRFLGRDKIIFLLL